MKQLMCIQLKIKLVYLGNRRHYWASPRQDGLWFASGSHLEFVCDSCLNCWSQNTKYSILSSFQDGGAWNSSQYFSPSQWGWKIHNGGLIEMKSRTGEYFLLIFYPQLSCTFNYKWNFFFCCCLK